jgi:hypothetical protein
MLSFGFAFGSFVPFHLCFRFFTQMDPEAFWPHEGVLFMMKQEVVKRGWLSDAQSSKKLKGEWKKASTLGMHLSAKYSGAREPKFANVDLILPVVVVGKREEAARTILNEKERLLPTPQVLQWAYIFVFRCKIAASRPTCFCVCVYLPVFVCSMQNTHRKMMWGSHQEMLHKRPRWTRKRKKALLMKGQVKLAPLMKRWCPLKVVQCTRVLLSF